MKRRLSDLSEIERIKTLDTLYTAAGSVRGRTDMKLFLKDLLTESERVMLGRRILIARLLLQGASQDEVREHWLNDQMPGYEQAIAGMEREFKGRTFATYYSAREVLRRLKKKYPLHFLLFPEPKRYKKL